MTQDLRVGHDYRILSKISRGLFSFFALSERKFLQKILKSCLKLEKLIENQIFRLWFIVNSAIAIPFYQKSVFTIDLGWGLFSSGAYFREGLFLREYGK